MTVGGGAFYVDSRWSSVTNDGRIPDYWRFDAMAAYKVTRNFTVQLNVYNLSDEYYLRLGGRRGLCGPRRRAVRLVVGPRVILRDHFVCPRRHRKMPALVVEEA